MNSQASSNQGQSTPDQASQAEPDQKISGASGFAAVLAKLEKENADDAGDGADTVDSTDGDAVNDDDDSGKPRKSGKAAPVDLIAMAETLGVKVEDLYKVKVPASGGREAMTIGQIKDKFAEWSTLETDRVAFDESKAEAEAKLEQAKAEIREIVSMLPPGSLKQDALARVASRLAERSKAAEAQLSAAFPEWRDPAVKTAHMADIEKLMAGYGFTKREAAGIKDARMLKLIRDSVRREALVRKALEEVKSTTQSRQTQQAGTRKPPGKPANQDQSRNPIKPTTERERFSAALNRS